VTGACGVECWLRGACARAWLREGRAHPAWLLESRSGKMEPLWRPAVRPRRLVTPCE
jgi:hypothetical protein